MKHFDVLIEIAPVYIVINFDCTYQSNVGGEMLSCLQNSFVRLQSPGCTKVGGGSRVAKVMVSDRWNTMAQNQYPVLVLPWDWNA